MPGRSRKISSTCLTPRGAPPRYAGVSVAGIIVMAAAISGAVDAKQAVSTEDAAHADKPGDNGGRLPFAGAFLSDQTSGSHTEPFAEMRTLLFGPHLEGVFFLAQSFPAGSFPGTVVCNEGGECVGISFPHPTDDGTPPEDGGVPPQVGQPNLTTPDLLVTKPRVAPDLEGRFSNGGNEEIW